MNRAEILSEYRQRSNRSSFPLGMRPNAAVFSMRYDRHPDVQRDTLLGVADAQYFFGVSSKQAKSERLEGKQRESYSRCDAVR